MEVQGSQPEKRIMATSMVAIFMVLGFMLFGVAYVVSQSFAYRYTGDSALLTPSLVLGSALLARGVFHLVVPLAHFGNQSLYLRPSPLMGCRKIEYELIEDFTFDQRRWSSSIVMPAAVRGSPDRRHSSVIRSPSGRWTTSPLS
ncbi:hypothetical protein FBG13_13965 [Cobetia marina]|uniref:hypothetical protein n=1 Tax=Cobetia marina TaxID=28258 RepID=UPI0010AED0F9|nr:hypothetical protein [Cobetia marina]TKD61059.1 hypothetical protein FBG13_13965 [Cobetia marina]